MTEERQEKPAEEPVKEEKPTETLPTQKTDQNTVFIGRKPVMNYVVACLTFFNSGAEKVLIKARGRAISRAIDTVELLRRSFVKDVQLKGISLGTEEVTREQGRKSNVSTIEIALTKP